MKTLRIIQTLTFISLGLIGLNAQDDTTIGTETVTVVKPYTPSVADAFKVKSEPRLNDSIVLQKKPITYTINSVPVASTFVPAKGRAAAVRKQEPENVYNTYTSLALGNFNNAKADFYTSIDIESRDERFDIGLNHLSSRGDIDGTPLDTDFYNTGLLLAYSKRDRELDWGVNLKGKHMIYNWYGLPENTFDEATVNGIEEKQNYNMAELGGYLNFEETAFKGGEVKFRRFWDDVSSGENRVILSPSVDFPITEESLAINVNLDYLDGSFENAGVSELASQPGITYGFFQVGVNPSLLILRDELTLNLGAKFVYGLDTKSNNSNFYIYPAVTASYRLADDLAIAFGGVEGKLRQNSYFDLVSGNPFVSPTLTITPTDQQYQAYLGLKGQLSAFLSYNIKGSYSAENKLPLYKLNPINQFRDDEKGYYYGNSFEVFYDDVKTLGLSGELQVAVNRDFNLGIKAAVYDYNTETGNPAWNLPNLEGSVSMDYQISENWYMGTDLFYIGERDDLVSQVVQNVQPSEFPSAIVTLDSYFDANAHLGYRFNDQLSIHVKARNLANNQYERWANFRVQSLQVLGGVTYKFDL